MDKRFVAYHACLLAAGLDNAIRLNPNNGQGLKIRGWAFEAKGNSRARADLASAKLLGE